MVSAIRAVVGLGHDQIRELAQFRIDLELVEERVEDFGETRCCGARVSK